MLFQLSPQFHLCPILPRGPIVGQNEVGVHAVENSEFTHGIGHGLIWPDNLQGFKKKRQKSEKRKLHMQKEKQTERKEREKENRFLRQ